MKTLLTDTMKNQKVFVMASLLALLSAAPSYAREYVQHDVGVVEQNSNEKAKSENAEQNSKVNEFVRPQMNSERFREPRI